MSRVTSIFSVHSIQSPVCGQHQLLPYDSTRHGEASSLSSQSSSETGGNVRERRKMRAVLFVLLTRILEMTKGMINKYEHYEKVQNTLYLPIKFSESLGWL